MPVLKNYRIQVVGVAEAAMVQIGKTGFPHEDLAVADLALLSRAVGEPVGGVLGNDILQKVTFRLNYSNEQLLIGPLGHIGDLGTHVKLRRSGGQFFITVQLMSRARDLLLDTGTNSTNLSWNTWQDVSKAWPARSMVEGIARAGVAASKGSLACMPKMRVGNADITDQAVRVQHAVGSGVFASEEFDGILGSDVLSEFEVTFDLGNDAIYLKKDSQFHTDENRYVTIGVQFVRNNQGSYTVMSVWKDSPALEGGVRPGDQIKAVDGETTDAMNARELSAKLHARQGTPVKFDDRARWNRFYDDAGNTPNALRARELADRSTEKPVIVSPEGRLVLKTLDPWKASHRSWLVWTNTNREKDCWHTE